MATVPPQQPPENPIPDSQPAQPTTPPPEVQPPMPNIDQPAPDSEPGSQGK